MNDDTAVMNRALAEASVTRAVDLDDGALARLPALFQTHFPGSVPLLIADASTFAAAGREAVARLSGAGIASPEPLIFPASPRLKPKVEHARAIHAGLASDPRLRAVAVGSGVINDLAKFGSALAGRPYMVVATAASMDGYAASGAPLIEDGFKRTLACPPPLAIVAEPEIVANAPAGMAGWGFGDLAGKRVAGLDWVVADALGIEAIEAKPFDLVQGNVGSWLADPAAIGRHDREATRRLTAGLIVSGFAIQQHGNSRPASGSEHQFSHLWEMEGLAPNGVAAAHGASVGIGTLAMLAAYEWLLARDIPDDAEARGIAALEDHAALRGRVERTFGHAGMRESAWTEAEAKQPTADTLRARIALVRAVWPELRAKLKAMLVPARTMQAALAAAGAPSTPEALGIDNAKLAGDFSRARLVRRRYTALDLLADLGWLDVAVADIFGPKGIFPR